MAKQMHGVVAIFKDPEQLKHACTQVRDKSFKKFDAYTPFPIHGIEPAMGLKRSFLPWVTFGAGLVGGTFGLWLQIWTSAVDWPLNVGGKPWNSLPAFIPVTFELTILFAGLATAGALFVACGLPKVDPPILDLGITTDKFALFISSDDPKYQESELKDLLSKAGAKEVRVV